MAKKEQICGIYKITNKNNQKVYIGQSVDIYTRWKNHSIRYKNENEDEYEKILYRAFRKHGIENFSFEIIEIISREQLNDREIYWIKEYHSYIYDDIYGDTKGYNANRGGSQIQNGEENHPNHKLTKQDIIDIRTRYANKERCKEVMELYKDKIGFSGFSKIWKGETWRNIMPEVYTEENKNFHLHNTGQKGDENGKSKLSTEDVIIIRTRKKNGEQYQDVYQDYKHTGISKSSFYNTWQGYNWKHIIIE